MCNMNLGLGQTRDVSRHFSAGTPSGGASKNPSVTGTASTQRRGFLDTSSNRGTILGSPSASAGGAQPKTLLGQ